MEWLQKADKVLSEEGPVHGDLDTVNSLIDQHRQFEEDLQVILFFYFYAYKSV